MRWAGDDEPGRLAGYVATFTAPRNRRSLLLPFFKATEKIAGAMREPECYEPEERG